MEDAEATVEDPEVVRQLHCEFLRAGADVMQAFSFYSSEDKLTNRSNKAGATIGVEKINREAAKQAREVRSGTRPGLHCTALSRWPLRAAP